MHFPMSHGVLVVSIDVPNDQPRQTARCQAIARRLTELLHSFRLSASWAIADLADRTLCEHVLRAQTPQEIALVGNAQWIGPSHGRAPLAHGLAERVQQAEQLGWSPSILALCETELDGNLDLLVKHRISVVRPAREMSGALARSLEPTALRFGIWQAPSACWLPARTWWPGQGRWTARRLITQAITHGSIAHVAFDLASCHRPDVLIRSMTQLLRWVVQQRDRGRLAVQPLSWIAAHRTRTRAFRTGASILRAA